MPANGGYDLIRRVKVSGLWLVKDFVVSILVESKGRRKCF